MASDHGEEDKLRGLHGEGMRSSEVAVGCCSARVGEEGLAATMSREEGVGRLGHGMHVPDTPGTRAA